MMLKQGQVSINATNCKAILFRKGVIVWVSTKCWHKHPPLLKFFSPGREALLTFHPLYWGVLQVSFVTAVLERWHRIPISYYPSVYPTNTTKCEDEFPVILKAQVLKTQFMHQQWSCQGEAQWGAQGAEGVPGEQHSWLLKPLVAGLLPTYKEWLLWWPLQRNVAPEPAAECLGSACPSASTQS